MSLATAITNIRTKIAAIYSKISDKGGTLPTTQDLANLPDAIDSIPSGGGTYDFFKDWGANEDGLSLFYKVIDERKYIVGTKTSYGTYVKPFVYLKDIPSNAFYNATNAIIEVVVGSDWTGSPYQPFFQANGLQTLIVGDGTYVKDMSKGYYCFYECYSLKNIFCILDFSNRASLASDFKSCYSLTYIRIKNVGFSCNWSSRTALDYDSLLYMVQNLKSGVDSLTLTIGSSHLAKLTATDEGNAAIAEAQEKGWTIA